MSKGSGPATSFRCGDDASSEFIASHEVGVLLIDDGFWRYCYEQVPVKMPVIFNGPYESGSLEGPVIGTFIDAVRTWADRYENLEDTVSTVRRHLGGQPDEQVELLPEEMAIALRRIEEMAVRCQREGIPLHFTT